MTITDELLARLADKAIKNPAESNRYNLRDVVRELMAETGISAADARRIVRNWDRRLRRY